MNNKLLLIFLTVSGLILCICPAHATTTETTNTTDLSRTISKIIELPKNNQNLLQAAIDRALIAKQISNNQSHVANTINTLQVRNNTTTTTSRTRDQNSAGTAQASDMGNTVTGYRTPGEAPKPNAETRRR
jgi:hypothetical protein